MSDDSSDYKPVGQMKMDERFRIVEQWIDGLAHQLHQIKSDINGLKQCIERLERKAAHARADRRD